MNRRGFLLALAALPFGAAAALALQDGRTEAERLAGVWPTDYRFMPGDVRRYGAVGDGKADDTGAFQSAIQYAAHARYRLIGPIIPTNFTVRLTRTVQWP